MGRCQKGGEVIRSGFALHITASRENDLSDAAIAEPLEQFADAKVLRPNVIEGADPAVKHVIVSMVGSGAIKRQNVSALLHDAEQRCIAPGFPA